MRTLHVGLRVADLDRSLGFYTGLGYEVLGNVPETESGSLTMLKLPGDEFVTLELVHNPGTSVDPGGLNHLVIQVESIHATLADLNARGIRPEGAPSSPDGSEDFWTALISDPDGYRIELVQWPAGHSEGMTEADFASEGGRD